MALTHTFSCDGCRQETTLKEGEEPGADPLYPRHSGLGVALPVGWIKIAGAWQGAGFLLPLDDMGHFCSPECAAKGVMQQMEAASARYEQVAQERREQEKYNNDMQGYARKMAGYLPEIMPEDAPRMPQPPRPPGRVLAPRKPPPPEEKELVRSAGVGGRVVVKNRLVLLGKLHPDLLIREVDVEVREVEGERDPPVQQVLDQARAQLGEQPGQVAVGHLEPDAPALDDGSGWRGVRVDDDQLGLHPQGIKLPLDDGARGLRGVGRREMHAPAPDKLHAAGEGGDPLEQIALLALARPELRQGVIGLRLGPLHPLGTGGLVDHGARGAVGELARGADVLGDGLPGVHDGDGPAPAVPLLLDVPLDEALDEGHEGARGGVGDGFLDAGHRRRADEGRGEVPGGSHGGRG